MKLFSIITLVAALALASVAAFFSVTGIGYLFAGSLGPVMAMAVALEVSKLVSASFLYRHWKSTSKILKVYMIIATIVLSVITSAGIYGYLTKAYATVALAPQTTIAQTSLVDSQKASADSSIIKLQQRSDLLEQRRNKMELRIDSALMGTKALSAQNILTRKADKEYAALQSQISIIKAKSDSLSLLSLQLKNQVSNNSELGPFLYISKSLGINLDWAIRWFILIIVVVFDPMSIALFLAYNVSVTKQDEAAPEPREPRDPEEHKFNQMLMALRSKATSERLNTAGRKRKSPELIREVPAIPAQNQVSSSPSQSGTTDPEFSPPELPYYLKPEFDWSDESIWRNDIGAVLYRRHNMLNRK